jgi:hypothetical protein
MGSNIRIVCVLSGQVGSKQALPASGAEYEARRLEAPGL